MKTTNLIKIASVILLGIALNGTVQASSDKFIRHAHPGFAKVTELVKLVNEEIRNMQMSFVHPFEDWMFESDYLNAESAAAIESWMLESNYLNEEVQPLESWMFSESRLSETEPESPVEPWMFETDYLCK